MKYVQTNIGKIPLEDYLDLQSQRYGYDDYKDLQSIFPKRLMWRNRNYDLLRIRR